MANVNTIAVDIEKLKTLSSETPSAKSVFKYLLERRRGRQYTNIKRVQRILKESGLELSADDISDVFRKLQDLGVGKIVFGRRSNPNRFIWTANLTSIGDILKGKSNEVLKQKPTAKKFNLPKLSDGETAAPQPAPTPVPEAPKPAAPFEPLPATATGHTLIVRKGGIEIQVPANLTEAEARGVAALLSLAS